jgi:pullulanase/glycogen debranching enzyme
LRGTKVAKAVRSRVARTAARRKWEQWPGKAYPLGATYDGAGTNFALLSEVAERVELCLFDADGTESRVPLIEVDGFVWHGFLPEMTCHRPNPTNPPQPPKRGRPRKVH